MISFLLKRRGLLQRLLMIKRDRQKIERLNKISKEAAKQCGRGLVPKVSMPACLQCYG